MALIQNTLILLSCALWFSPAVSRAVRRISEYSEFACDDEVIQSGNSRADYAEDILDLSLRTQLSPAIVSISSGNLSHRIQLVLEGGRSRQKQHRKSECITPIGIAFLLAPFFFTYVAPKAAIEQRNEFGFHIITPGAFTEKETNEASDFKPIKYVSGKPQESLRIIEYRSQFEQPTSINHNNTHTTKVDLELAHESITPVAPEVEAQGFLPVYFQPPSYPSRAIQKGIEAKISVTFDVNATGAITNLRFDNQPHLNYFKKPIETALKNSKYKPLYLDNVAVEVKNVQQKFSFKLIQK